MDDDRFVDDEADPAPSSLHVVVPQPFAREAFGEVGAMRRYEDPVRDDDAPQPDGLVDVVQSLVMIIPHPQFEVSHGRRRGWSAIGRRA